MDAPGRSAAARGAVSETPSPSTAAERAQVVALARGASVEMTWHDVDQLASCRLQLAPGTAVFVSHLPAQTWRQTIETCVAVRAHGFEPVPHVPVRRLADVAAFEQLIADLVTRAQVSRVLLIAGDAPQPVGAFSAALDALRSGVLAAHGIDRVFVAGHPEGHPQVADEELRRAERGKVAFAVAHDLELTFLSQFFFDAEPFLAWARRLRTEGVQARLVAGLAGPARLTTLFKYAVRCGVGPSIRALGSRPTLFGRLSGERDPEPIVRAIARAATRGDLGDVGIHFFSFGGLARTCEWLRALAQA
jgi:methylenetetrahydrofolate reductase (NADPH)